MPGEMIPIVLFISIAAAVILRGPLGKALADRMAGRVGESESARDMEMLRGAVGELRARMEEMEERMDFAERLLARQRQPGRLGDGG